ncbi:zinc-binding oxidoreductase [Ophiostoma piceae UAMH 11346]|uniref:Zinc-binding oxidoreductase n=1 Tax=Ophiostoma piceae (strain UAMH 11346) TaxID=1262450 RepID=S3BSK4_OPHP1|nr:zinc-binding oxidoreductase [Ophiostoma piceae UAMH 11346]
MSNTAAILLGAGEAPVLTARAIPTPGPKDVLIRAHAVAINPIDRARHLGFLVRAYPVVIGSDIAGVVEAVGSEVDAFRKGDRVAAVLDGFMSGNNDREAFQTYALAPMLTTSKLPDALSFVQGSTVSLVLQTAAMIYFDGLGIPLPKAAAAPASRTGTSDVIWGGASGVGQMAIQLGRYLGFNVLTTASPRHHDRLRSIGARLVVDYADPIVATKAFLAASVDTPVSYAIDCISSAETTAPHLEAILEKSASFTKKLAHTNALKGYLWKGGVEHRFVNATDIHTRRRDVGQWLFADKNGDGDNITTWLAKGTFMPPPAKVLAGGLAEGRLELISGGVSGEKLVVEVD